MPVPTPRFPSAERGRLFIRQCGGHVPEGSALIAMIGVLEVPDAAEWRREVLHDFALIRSGDEVLLSFQGEDRPLPDHAPCTDLAGLATSIDAYAPCRTLTGLGWGGGTMTLRDTRAPSPEGTRLALVLAIARVPEGVLPDAHMADLTVHSRSDGSRRPATGSIVVADACDPATVTGEALSSIHKTPIWGWDGETYGFRSTMRLDVIDDCTRLQDIILSGDGDPEEIARLQRSTMNCVQAGRDPMYDEYRRLLAAEGLIGPWDETPTLSLTRRREEATSRIVEKLMKAA